MQEKKMAFLAAKKILSLLVFGVLAFTAFEAKALTFTPIRLELSGDPGETIIEDVTLFNELDITQTYYVSYANFEAQGETGNPSLIEATEGLGTWMKAETEVTLEPKASAIIPVSITIPGETLPGGYFGAVLWGTQPPTQTGGDQVVINSQAGVLVLLSVNGDVKEAGGLLNYQTKDGKKFYESLPVTFTYRFRNDGGDRIKPVGEVIIKNTFGLTAARILANPVTGNVLPTQIRKFETTWKASGKYAASGIENEQKPKGFFDKAAYEWHNFALGHYTAYMNMTYGENNQTATGEVGFWVFPWHFLIVLVVILILLVVIFTKAIRGYNRWVIRQAEERLRQMGSTPPQTP